MDNMLSKTWFRLLLGGIGMFTLSAVIFGGFVHTLIISPGSLAFLTFLIFSGASSMASGVLMMFDSMKYKVREEVERAIRRKENPNEAVVVKEEDQEHMDELLSRCERLRPEHLERS